MTRWHIQHAAIALCAWLAFAALLLGLEKCAW